MIIVQVNWFFVSFKLLSANLSNTSSQIKILWNNHRKENRDPSVTDSFKTASQLMQRPLYCFFLNIIYKSNNIVCVLILSAHNPPQWWRAVHWRAAFWYLYCLLQPFLQPHQRSSLNAVEVGFPATWLLPFPPPFTRWWKLRCWNHHLSSAITCLLGCMFGVLHESSL